TAHCSCRQGLAQFLLRVSLSASRDHSNLMTSHRQPHVRSPYRCLFGEPLCVRLSVVFLTGASALSSAAAWQSPESIETVAEAFVTQHQPAMTGTVTVQTQPIDRRLKLKACAKALEGFLPAGAGWRPAMSVGVRCAGPVAWKVYVQVRTESRIQVARVTRALPPGHTVTPQDFEWVEQTAHPGSLSLQKGLHTPAGRVLRTACGAGQTLTQSMLQPDYLVRRGERVTLASGDSALAIRMGGQALADAAAGERVRVRNSSSGRVVEGIVRQRGVVEIVIF
ncbi:MAG: flagellar basal body P-ring formation chaperone FlgA, partial [Pseudomonadota bacterium]